MVGSSSGVPYSHQAIASSPSTTSAACASPWSTYRLLQFAVGLRTLAPFWAIGVKVDAPAATEDAVVATGRTLEQVPSVPRPAATSRAPTSLRSSPAAWDS